MAIKVLPAEFSQDPERLRRFEQEARATAAPTFFAYIADARRDIPAAVRWLEHAFTIRDPNAVFHRGLPPTLRAGDPHFETVLSRYGL